MSTFACGRNSTADEDVPSALLAPTAVEELTGEMKSSFPRLSYGEDLVEKLFADVLEKDTALKALLERVDTRYDQHGDTVRRYERFAALNAAYYTSAQGHARTLKDSTVRVQQIELLDRSHDALQKRLVEAERLEAAYTASAGRITDLVMLIKLQRTRDLMEAYQRKEPSFVKTWKEEVGRIRDLEERLKAQVK
ncbi:MAG TPA: hypothetical protein PL070_17170 [Flavobacteriales bacterium]|nr:hypothetical protein [Flavobacteriales bacterium]